MDRSPRPPTKGADRAADPVAGLVREFARTRGVEPNGATQVADLWPALRARGDDAPGLSFAAWAAPAAIGGPLVPLLTNSPDVGTLLEQLTRFHPLFGSDRITLHRNGSGLRLTLHRADGEPALPDTVDACFSLLCRVSRHLTQSPSAVARVRLRRAEPPVGGSTAGAYREVFGAVTFGAVDDACTFDAAIVATPIAGADPVILALVEPYARRRLDSRGLLWSVAVAGALTTPDDRFPTDWPPTLGQVARTLAVSPRALQQYLRAEGETYSQLVDGVQRERTLALLAGSDLLLSTIAIRVGFSTPAALTRAVRRWTGSSPSQLRLQSRQQGHAAG